MNGYAYAAGPIFNRHQLEVMQGIRQLLEEEGYEVFDPYRESRDVWCGRKPSDCTPEERKQVLDGNVGGLLKAGLVVAWVGGTTGGKTDTGVSWEMGFARALRHLNADDCDEYPITIAYIHPEDERKEMNLMLAGTVDAAVCGPQQLAEAVLFARNREWHELVRQFDPEHIILPEGSTT